MKKIRRIGTALLTLLVCLVFVPSALAHPLGNFSINHYAGLHVSPDSISIDYVLDMAEIPAFQEIAVFDANGNGLADSSEAAGYHAVKCAALRPDLKLLLDNRALELTLASSSVEFPAGAGGLPTLRLTCGFTASLPSLPKTASLSFADHSYSERIGWREIVVSSKDVSLRGDFAATSLSNHLTEYPKDLLSSPLDQRHVTVGIEAGDAAAQTHSGDAAQSVTSLAGSRSDAFTQLVALDTLTPPVILFALLVSFVWGALHAMTPGHGKTVVGAYLVGSRGTVKHAFYLGLTTTITHTLGVFAFGLITLFAAQYIVPEKLFPWISLLSGIFVVGIGLSLFLERFKTSGLGARLKQWRSRRPGVQTVMPTSLQGMQFETVHPAHPHGVVLTGGHAHEHARIHSHDGPSHTHGHRHHHDHDHDHTHAGHSHHPPESMTLRNVIALGISGGLLPCPSALVVLLGAIALNRIGFGLALVLAFSLGLAGALTLIGVLFLYAGRLIQRFPSSGNVVGFLPVVSALFVSVLGVGMVVKALTEIGML